jgi:hypothetical protein
LRRLVEADTILSGAIHIGIEGQTSFNRRCDEPVRQWVEIA